MASLSNPLRIGNFTVPNRLYRAPVLEGAGTTKMTPSEEYLTAFEPNARAGIGMVIQGNSIVQRDGNTAPGMICLEDEGLAAELAKMTRKIHDYGTRVVIQIGHGGIFSLPSWSKKARAGAVNPILAPSPLPFPLSVVHPGVHVMTNEEVHAMADKFGRGAKVARAAGYDAVQLASSNIKLLHQFLTPVYNRRDDEFGGSTERRMRILGLIREKIAEHAGADYPVLVKIPMLDHARGISLEEGIEMCRIAERQGFAAITPVEAFHLPSTAICRGDFPEASYDNASIRKGYLDHTQSALQYHFIRLSNRHYSRKHPFAPVWNREIFRRAKQAVSIPVFAVGGIRTLDEIESILGPGDADMIGIGRPLYAEPALPARLLAGDRRAMACESCNRCVPPQMLGLKGTCYNPEIQDQRRQFAKEAAPLADRAQAVA